MSSLGTTNLDKEVKRMKSASAAISFERLKEDCDDICEYINGFFEVVYSTHNISATHKLKISATYNVSKKTGDVFINIKQNGSQIVHVSFHGGRSKKQDIGSIHFKWEDYEYCPTKNDTNNPYYNLLEFDNSTSQFKLGPPSNGYLPLLYRFRYNINRIWYNASNGKLCTYDNYETNRNSLEKKILRCINEYGFIIDADEYNRLFSEENKRDLLLLDEEEKNKKQDIIDRSVRSDRNNRNDTLEERIRDNNNDKWYRKDRDRDEYDNKSGGYYYLKYLKYKNKYLKLKKLIQLD